MVEPDANLVHTDEAEPTESKRSDEGNRSVERGTLSSAVEHRLHTAGVVGSIPTASTIPLTRRGRPRKARSRPKWRWLYFVHSPQAKLVKIGVSDDMRRRFVSLCTASSVPLVLLGGVVTHSADELERELHEIFAPWRQHGEWFEAQPELLGMIAGMATDTEEDMDAVWLSETRAVQDLVRRR